MKTRILVFGNGLLGNSFNSVSNCVVLPKSKCDITDMEQVKSVLRRYNPAIVINCAGIVPRNVTPVETIFKVNSFAPHRIAELCYKKRQFIHVSTDCVFSGTKGMYVERDTPDATTTYGVSKIFGEPDTGLVIRASFVGLPDTRDRGLLAWASKQREITGYDKVFWNGTTPVELVTKILEFAHEGVTGIRHVYSYTITKYELLKCAQEVYGWNTIIYKESNVTDTPQYINKTLSSMYGTGFIAKPIRRQLKEMLNVPVRNEK